MGWYHMGWGWGGWSSGFMMILWALLIIAAIYWLIQSAQRNGRREENRPESALDILKKRYARGEINKSEFEDRKKDLL